MWKRVLSIEYNSLPRLLEVVSTHKGSWKNVQLMQDAKMFLWARYDPNNDLIYPTNNNWDDLLLDTIKLSSYDKLTYDEVLSILFGLNHRNRIVDGLWWSMFERGVTQKLLARLLILDTD